MTTFEPSPEEIKAMTAEIRRGWSPETERHRRVIQQREWQVPGTRHTAQTLASRPDADQ